jgi:hypothetical protein
MPVHPRSIGWFQEEREEVYGFSTAIAEKIKSGKRHIIIGAPVKCGKRVIVECLTLTIPDYQHMYVCSLNRKDIKTQKEELDQYNISMQCVYSDEHCKSAISEITHLLSSGKTVVIHFDECDYGSGKKQKMSGLFAFIKSNDRIVKLYYSATPEEVLYSDATERGDYELMEFTPPESYCGAQYFLDNDLVFDAEPLFEKEGGQLSLTDHCKMVLRDSIKPDRNIVGLRVTGKGISGDLLKANKTRLEAESGRLKIDDREFTYTVISATDSFEWEDEERRNGYTRNQDKIFVFVVNQTCGRSTDLNGWHHRLACWHDARKINKSNLNTLKQAMLRPSHYDTNYCESHGVSTSKCRAEGCQPMAQPIRMYVPKECIENAASGDIKAYVDAGGKPPTRTAKVKSSYTYDINTEQSLGPYTFEKANEYIVDKGFTAKRIEDFEKQGDFYKSGRVLGIGPTAIENRPVSREEAETRLKLQYHRTQFVFIPCYEDLSDPASIVWIAVRKKDRQVETRPISTTKSSMFSS